MGGAEIGYVGTHGSGALCEWLEAVPAQQRIEPDEAAAGAGKALDFGFELRWVGCTASSIIYAVYRDSGLVPFMASLRSTLAELSRYK